MVDDRPDKAVDRIDETNASGAEASMNMLDDTRSNDQTRVSDNMSKGDKAAALERLNSVYGTLYGN